MLDRCADGPDGPTGYTGRVFPWQPRQRWFAVLMSANMASRMMARMALRRALAA